jgi:hypothetical protein
MSHKPRPFRRHEAPRLSLINHQNRLTDHPRHQLGEKCALGTSLFWFLVREWECPFEGKSQFARRRRRQRRLSGPRRVIGIRARFCMCIDFEFDQTRRFPGTSLVADRGIPRLRHDALLYSDFSFVRDPSVFPLFYGKA